MFESLVLGVDPGLTRCGWGVVARREGHPRAVAYGTITTPSTQQDVGIRLDLLYTAIDAVLDKHRPSAVAIEQVLFNRNIQTGMATGQAAGVALLCFARHDLSVASYAPTRVKSAVTGYGKADKLQVRHAVARILALRQVPPTDAADALALALCHLTCGPLSAAVAAVDAVGTNVGGRLRYDTAVADALARDDRDHKDHEATTRGGAS